MYIFLYKYVYRLTIVSPFWLTQSPWFLAPAAPSNCQQGVQVGPWPVLRGLEPAHGAWGHGGHGGHGDLAGLQR